MYAILKKKLTDIPSILFPEGPIHFFPRKANKAAHAMAKWGQKNEQPNYWVEEVPMEVEDAILEDQRRWNGNH